MILSIIFKGVFQQKNYTKTIHNYTQDLAIFSVFFSISPLFIVFQSIFYHFFTSLFSIYTKKENDIDYCYFSKANIFYDFCFEKFLEQIEKGNIQFDIRIGVYNSGKNYGKTHDHGSGFRIKKEFFNNLYSSNEELEQFFCP